jgi:hypothetical protein
MKHGTAVSLRLAALVLSCAGGVAGCDNDFEAPSELDSLRVLAVRPEPASGRPGITSKLALTFVDAHEPPDQAALHPREIQIAWLGGCHNPPTRQYFGCFPLLSQLAARLSPRVVETQTEGVPPGFFATTTEFEIPVPNDILTKAVSMPGDPVHFGVSYAFFAVCAGELRARPDFVNRVPLDCVDPASGAPRGHRDFVTGYTTLYTYDGFDCVSTTSRSSRPSAKMTTTAAACATRRAALSMSAARPLANAHRSCRPAPAKTARSTWSTPRWIRAAPRRCRTKPPPRLSGPTTTRPPAASTRTPSW